MKNIFIPLFLLISAFTLNAQIPNGSFEQWADDGSGNLNPVGWFTSNNSPDTSVEMVSELCDGSAAMRVRSFSSSSFVFPGFASLEFVNNTRPSHLNFCIEANVMPSDFALVYFSAYNQTSFGQDTLVASPDSCTFKITTNLSNSTYSLPISYLNNLPIDLMNIDVLAGFPNAAQLGTMVTLDNLWFSYFSGVEENSQETGISLIYPQPSSDKCVVEFVTNKSSLVEVEVFDLTGRLVSRESPQAVIPGKNMVTIHVDHLPQGYYRYFIHDDDLFVTGPVAVSH